MTKHFFILFCSLIFAASCYNAGDTKTENNSSAAEGSRQQSNNSQPANSAAASANTPPPNANQSPTIVNSNGQNITFSTAGELEIVGNEINYDVLLPSDILFDFDKHALRPEAADLLQKLKAHFAGKRTNQVHIFGHTDSKGDDQYNAVLSQKRAIAVQKWLKENTDIYAMALGMGEREPLVPNENADGSDNPENRQRNRRVTVRVALKPDVNQMLNQNGR